MDSSGYSLSLRRKTILRQAQDSAGFPRTCLWVGMNGNAEDISILSSGGHYHYGMTRVVYKVYTFSARRCKQSMQIRLFECLSKISISALIVPTGWLGTHYNYFSLMEEKLQSWHGKCRLIVYAFVNGHRLYHPCGKDYDSHYLCLGALRSLLR